jgi:hypothetical protein
MRIETTLPEMFGFGWHLAPAFWPMPYCWMLRLQRNDMVGPSVSAAWAVLALALLLSWQFLTVQYNRAGNWTALFLTGQSSAIPPDLTPGTYRFPGAGYDGEMYRSVAHDPFMKRGFAHYMDGPAQRYHRLLVPLLAYLLVAGHQPWIDASYIAVVDMFVLLGAYWFSRWAALAGLHPAWAPAFLLVPASLISMDRMTVDVGLAAFTFAFALYWQTRSWAKLYVVLLLACLVRETGVLLVGGVCLFELLNRRFARVVLWASSSLPMFIWYLFIRGKFHERTHYGVPFWFARRLGAGLFYRMFQPPRYPLAPIQEAIARSADVLALAAILLAAIMAIFLLHARPWGPVAISAVLFTALVFALTNGRYWTDVNGYARVLSPLLILVALPFLAGKTGTTLPWWLGLAPAALVDLRLSLQFASTIGGVIRGLVHL